MLIIHVNCNNNRKPLDLQQTIYSLIQCRRLLFYAVGGSIASYAIDNILSENRRFTFALFCSVKSSVSRTLCCVPCKLIKVVGFPAALALVKKKSAKQNKISLCDAGAGTGLPIEATLTTIRIL